MRARAKLHCAISADTSLTMKCKAFFKIIQFSYKLGEKFEDIATDGRNALMCNLKVVPAGRGWEGTT